MDNWFYRKLQKRCETDGKLDSQSERILKDSLLPRSGYHLSDIRRSKSNDSAIDAILSFYDLDRSGFAKIERENVLYRTVGLEGPWWKTAADPMLAIMPDKSITALIPKPLGGYRFFNSDGKSERVNKQNASKFSSAYNICKPFHKEPVHMRDLLSFMFEFLSFQDILMMVLLCLFSVLLGTFFTAGIAQILYAAQHATASSLSSIILFTLIVGLSIAVSLFLKTGLNILRTRFSQKVNFHVGNAALIRVFHLQPEQFKQKNRTEYWQMFNSIRECCGMLMNIILKAPVSLLFIITYLIQVILLIPDYSWAIILAWLLSILFVFVFNIAVNKHYKRYETANRQQLSFQTAAIAGMDKIQAMHAESRVFHQWSKIYSVQIRESRERYKYTLAINLVSKILSIALTFIIVLHYSSYDISKALFLTVITVAGMIVSYTAPFSVVLLNYRLCRTEWEYFRILMDIDCNDDDTKEKVEDFNGSLSVAGLSFSYDDNQSERKTINNMSFNIQPNEYVSIVGMSGCGKSTLLKLLIGAELPQAGAVFYGEHELARSDRRSLLQKIGVVLQDDVLIPGTIRQNLSISPRPVTEEDMWDALKSVGIDDLVRSYPFGLDTRVSSASSGMSKGQMQRILIARAIISKPKMLIFDEATSALDNIAQHEIQSVLDKIKCTRIIVAHRLSTVKNCDRILVMDQGRIVEEGSYQTLIEKNGLFAELAKYQRLDV